MQTIAWLGVRVGFRSLSSPVGRTRWGRLTYDALMRLHVLDATYELFRAYFGYPRRSDPSGREVGAVWGLADSTRRLLREPGVTHVAAAFDTSIRSFRNDVYDGYKTGEGVEQELFDQFPLAERTLEALGVVVWRMEEFEADDALASAAFRFGDDVDQVVLLSPDKDLAQCVVGDRVVMYDRRRRMMIDEDGVRDKWGISPVSMPDYLALVGDTADGIPGIRAWGAKSASTLLARYRRIERIPLDHDLWDVPVRGGLRLCESLAANMDDALFYRTLTTLRRDVPIAETIDDLEWVGEDEQAVRALAAELGF
ncbi:DNA polymerase I [bacterium BMS3Abin02]|nr:DNA polymerase I [bacterium BMS3Abin02]GBE21645.1 DNA polymerase I [bacterium BMS3Bbin01]